MKQRWPHFGNRSVLLLLALAAISVAAANDGAAAAMVKGRRGSMVVTDAGAGAVSRLRSGLSDFVRRYDYIDVGVRDRKSADRANILRTYVARFTPFNLNTPARNYWRRPRNIAVSRDRGGNLCIQFDAADDRGTTDNAVINDFKDILVAQFGAHRIRYVH